MLFFFLVLCYFVFQNLGYVNLVGFYVVLVGTVSRGTSIWNLGGKKLKIKNWGVKF
jgi:hypothetical protein